MHTTLDQIRTALKDRYQIEREIGRGGMATVFLALERDPERQVAIKVLDPEVATPRLRDRFVREIELVSKLSHPHIVPIYTAGEADGLLYFVMPYVDGETVRERLNRDSTIPPHEALEIAREVASALAYAHDRGVIHRDIKPANILLAGGQAMVADFGVARAVHVAEDGEAITLAGRAIGTPGYMSPEQAMGSKAVDARSDVYSLGCVLYEMLVGETPDTLARTSQGFGRRSHTPPQHREVFDRLPFQIERSIAKAIALDPQKRFEGADDFGKAITFSSLEVEIGGSSIHRWREALVSLAVALILVAVAASGREVLAGKVDTPDPRRVMVAVFENRTGEADLERLGHMASDWITEGLSQSGLVEVVGFGTAMMATEKVDELGIRSVGERIRTMALESDAGTVISGSFYLDPRGETLYFSADITDAEAGRIVRAIEPVSGPRENLSAIVETLAQRVLGALASRVDPSLASFADTWEQPPSLEAYREYVEGLRLLMRLRLPESARRLHRAAEMDSVFATPLLWATMVHTLMGQYSQAEAISERLLARRDDLAPADRLLLDWNLAWNRGRIEEALTTIRRAGEIAPGPETSLLLGMTALRLNRPEEAIEVLESLNPNLGISRGFFLYWHWLADAYHRLGRHRQELAIARRGRALYPNEMVLLLGELRALAALGEVDEANGFIGRIGSFRPRPDLPPGLLFSMMGQALRAHGHEDAAGRWLSEAISWFRSQPADLFAAEAFRYEYARALYHAGRYGEARPIFRELRLSQPDSASYLGYLGSMAAAEANLDAALAMADSLAVIDLPHQFGRNKFWEGVIHARLNRVDAALPALYVAVDRSSPDIWWDLEVEPGLDNVRELPGFRDLVRPQR